MFCFHTNLGIKTRRIQFGGVQNACNKKKKGSNNKAKRIVIGVNTNIVTNYFISLKKRDNFYYLSPI